MGQPLWRNSLAGVFFIKVNTHLPCEPTISFLDVHTKKKKKKKTYIHTTAHKSVQQPKWPSVGKGMNKLQCIHTLEYYSAIKSNEFVILATSWKNLSGFLLTKRAYSPKVTFQLHNVLVKTKLQIRSAVDRVRGV